MNSACIATKTGQGAFLAAEKTGTERIFSSQKKGQGAFLNVEKLAECIFNCEKTGRMHFGQQ